MRRTTSGAAAIDWLVFSSDQISEATQIIKDLDGETTIDVLGIGIYFEDISDNLFPGTSTLHNWLRYKFFTAALLYAISRQPNTKKKSRELFRDLEVALQKKLTETAESKGLKPTGIHGSMSGEKLKTFPSSLYWNGINEFGFFGASGIGLTDLLDRLDRYRGFGASTVSKEFEEFVEAPELPFDPEVKSFCKNVFSDVPKLTFKNDLWLDLEVNERDWYEKKLATNFPYSLSCVISKMSKRTLALTDDLFDLDLRDNEVTGVLFEQAERYSRFNQGANYLYNLVLAKSIHRQADNPATRDAVVGHLLNLKEWRSKNIDLADWRMADITGALISFGKAAGKSKFKLRRDDSVDFVESLKTALFSAKSEHQISDDIADLIRRRESRVKGGEHRTRFSDRIKKPGYISSPREFYSHMTNYRWKQGKSNALDLKGTRAR